MVLISVLVLTMRFLLAPAPLVTLTVQLRTVANQPVSGIGLTLTQQPSGETYAPCTTDADGRCHWQVPGLRLYEVVVAGQGVSAETALALGDAGLRGLGVMLGTDDHVQTLFIGDGNVTIADPADPSVPYIPAAGEASRHLQVTPTLIIAPTAPVPPAAAVAVTQVEQSGNGHWTGLALALLLGTLLLAVVVVYTARRRGEGNT